MKKARKLKLKIKNTPTLRNAHHHIDHDVLEQHSTLLCNIF